MIHMFLPPQHLPHGYKAASKPVGKRRKCGGWGSCRPCDFLPSPSPMTQPAGCCPSNSPYNGLCCISWDLHIALTRLRFYIRCQWRQRAHPSLSSLHTYPWYELILIMADYGDEVKATILFTPGDLVITFPYCNNIHEVSYLQEGMSIWVCDFRDCGRYTVSWLCCLKAYSKTEKSWGTIKMLTQMLPGGWRWHIIIEDIVT